MKGVIIDGVAASGKTSILKLLQKKIIEEKPNISKLFISEHYTQRMLEHLAENGKLNGAHVKNHVSDIIRALNVFQDMLKKSKFINNPKGAEMVVILERFILTHLSAAPLEDHYKHEEISKHFQKLSDLGFSQVVLAIPEDKILERIMSTTKYRNDKWKEYLLSKGTESQIKEYYENWQKRILNYVNKYKNDIQTEIITVVDNDYSAMANMIYEKFIS